VTQEEQQARHAAFTNVSVIALPSISVSEIDAALDTMKLDPVELSTLKALVSGDAGSPVPASNGLSVFNTTPAAQRVATRMPVRLVSVTLWDTHDQDGDVVTVSSAGYHRQIVLTNAPQTVAFPVNQASAVQVVGTHDGGGGITLGIRGPNQEFLMPIMSEGQSLTLPVTN
jgi:hypothetical protein